MSRLLMFWVVLLNSMSCLAATPISSIAVGNSPFAVALNGDSSRAVVVNLFPVKNVDGTDGPNIRVLDTVNSRELRAFRAGTRLVSVSISGATALIVNEDQDTVRIVSTDTGQEVGQIPVGARPSNVIITGPNSAIATNGTSGDISFLDITARRATSTLKVGNDPRAAAVHPQGRYTYVALGGDNAVGVVDLQGTPRLVGTVAVGRNPVAVAFSPNGSRAAIANLTNNTLSVLDTSNVAAPKLVANIPVGAQPTFLAFGSLNPNLVYVSNQGAGYVTVVDISKEKAQMVQGVIQLGVSASGLAVGNGGTRLYVAEFKNNANLRIYDLQNLGSLDAKPVFDVPGEPDAVTNLVARGNCATDFYIAEATLAAGAREGFWGMEVGLSRDPRELTGGFNLGGAFDGGGRNPGFGAFSLTSPQRVTVTINAQPLGPPIALKVDLQKNGQRLAGVEGTPTPTTPLRFSVDLTAGFHVVVINSTSASGRGTFQLGLETAGSFAAGVVVGGFITRGPSGASLSGFGAFCLPQTQDVNVRLLGLSEYGDAAAGELILTLRDAQRSVVRTVDNSVGGGGTVTLPAAPAVPANIRYFVEASAPAGGDGSSSRPLRSITEAINRAVEGEVIFVRKGTYSRSATGEVLPIGSQGTGLFGFRANVQLIGAGADGTIIDGENADSNTVTIPVRGVRLAGFTIKRSGAAAVYVFRSANVIVESNFTTGNIRFGIGAEGSSGIIIRNNVATGNLETGIALNGSLSASPPPGAPGNCPAIAGGAYGAWIVNNTTSDNRADGILVAAGGNYCIADNIANNNGSSGIEFNNRAESGTVPPLTGSVVNNALASNGGQQFAFAGTGILSTENGARIELIQGNRLTKNRPYGIGIFLNGRAGRIVGNTVTATQSNAVLVRSQAMVDEISDNEISDNGDSGVFIDDQSRVGTVAGNRLDRNRKGLSVLSGSTLDAVNNQTIDTSILLGIEIAGASRVSAMTNVVVSNSGAGGTTSGGGMQVREASIIGICTSCRFANSLGQGGVFVNAGSQVTLVNAVIDGSVTQGLFATGSGTRATLTGGSVINTRRDAASQGGFGLNSQSGAVINCSGVSLSGNAAGNIFTSSGGSTTGC